jgi:hypothetical protein
MLRLGRLLLLSGRRRMLALLGPFGTLLLWLRLRLFLFPLSTLLPRLSLILRPFPGGLFLFLASLHHYGGSR